jgi:uncharacterized DUF497 family protein
MYIADVKAKKEILFQNILLTITPCVYTITYRWSKNGVHMDRGKNQINKQKHGFYLSDIVDIFDDPHLIEWYDKNHSSLEEDRFICLGALRGAVILFVVFTEQGEDVRLITARKAEPHEEVLYYGHYRRETGGN